MQKSRSHNTYNSTSAGIPFPMVLSHLDSADKSRTFERGSCPACARASAPRERVKKKEVTFMVDG